MFQHLFCNVRLKKNSKTLVCAGSSCLNSLSKKVNCLGCLGYMLHDLYCEYNDSRVLFLLPLSVFLAKCKCASVLFLFMSNSRHEHRLGGGAQTREWCSDFSFVRYPVMIILASKPQIWPCCAVDHSISGDGAALPRLRSLSAAKLCWQRQSGTQDGGHFECTLRRSSEARVAQRSV